MKAVDPTIKTGGPAVSNHKPDWLITFLKTAGEYIDFLGWHHYATFSKEISHDLLIADTVIYGYDVEEARQPIKKYCPGRDIELAITEMNSDGTGGSLAIMKTMFNAAWYASVLKHLIESRCDISIYFHLSGGRFVFSAIHDIQRDVPSKNLITMYDTALEFGKYPINPTP